jgi:pyruvate,water dikinase
MLLMKLFKSGPSCELLPALDAEQTSRYKRFRRLLEHNRTALALQTDLERIYFDNRPFMPQMIEKVSGQLLLEVDGMVNALSGMTQRDYEPLLSVLRSIERSVRDEWSGLRRRQTEDLVLPLDRIKLEQMSLVGAKAANLAHITGELRLPTPQGFAVTTTACSRFLQETGLGEEIDAILADLDDDDPARLEAVSRQIEDRIMATELPRSILTALQDSAAVFASDQQLAVRSSAIGEDGELSFAGQYSSMLNVTIDELSQAYRHVIASLYSASALSYRMHHGLDDRETPMGVLILAMIQPQYSGVLYTVDPANEDPDSITISWVAGLGDQLVGGEASAEQIFRVDKTTRELRADGGSNQVGREPPAFLGDLTDYALRIEENYGHPLDIEWAVDQSGAVTILQARPLLLHQKNRQHVELQTFEYAGHPVLIEGGKCASGGVTTGRVLIRTTTSADSSAPPLEPDTILVVRTAATTFTPWVSKVKGIITDVGSSASHLASVAREFGVPALFDTQVATTTLKDGAEITLWAGRQRVYQGVVEELLDKVGKVKRPIFDSPAHQRLQRLLDLISPLNLTDPNSADFSPEKCQTAHDIIRFSTSATQSGIPETPSS